MAGVTSPKMMSGIKNDRKWLKILLKVTKHLTAHSGKNIPQATPRIMAMTMRGSSPILDKLNDMMRN